jgi:hypothetical protein
LISSRSFSRRWADSSVERMALDLVICDVRADPVIGKELPVVLLGMRPGIRLILLADREDEARLMASLRTGISEQCSARDSGGASPVTRLVPSVTPSERPWVRRGDCRE